MSASLETRTAAPSIHLLVAILATRWTAAPSIATAPCCAAMTMAVE